MSFLASLRPVWLLVAIVCCFVSLGSGSGCVPPTVISCPDGQLPCDGACVDVNLDVENCGTCGTSCGTDEVCAVGACMSIGACATNNGGCSPDAFCMDIAGRAECLCGPGFTGTGLVCSACTACAAAQFMTAACTPTTDAVCSACTVCGVGDFASIPCSATADAVCSACSQGCLDTHFQSQVCGGTSDLVCTPCTQCLMGTYAASSCGGTQDRTCAPCGTNCAQCFGPGNSCVMCNIGFTNVEGVCLAAMCGNGNLEPGEACDDGDLDPGDGCSDMCNIEADSYCFGETFSVCRTGSCVSDPATGALGGDFVLDGAGTASAAGTTLTQRSTIRTTANVAYPMMIEATVVYAGGDITYLGARGPGTRDGTNADEPTDTLRARLTQSSGLMQIVSGTNSVEAGVLAPFTPMTGVPYRVRYVDNGFSASVEWTNLTLPSQSGFLPAQTTFHGSGDRAFIGGGDQGNVTVSDIRACSAPMLPVASGLVARYSAIPSWTVTSGGFTGVSQWNDISGNGRHLTTGGLGPSYDHFFINSARPGLNFSAGAQLSTSAFALTTDVTVFAVIHHNTPDQFGAIAHHGDRDNDWSMEQSGVTDRNTLHWQTDNDNVNVNVTLTSNTSYVMAGRIDGNARYFSATTFTGTSPAPATFVDAIPSITAGSKILFVGTSDNNESSNAYIGDLVYFNRALSDVERDAVIDYLRRLWRP